MTLSLEEMKANRRKWVEALRSGKYEQGTGVLKTQVGGMCCLGVLADVSGCEWKQDDDGDFRADGSYCTAPDKAVGFVGLATDAGDYGDTSLAEQNDSGRSFSKIADIIESEPPGLFIDSTPTGSAS